MNIQDSEIIFQETFQIIQSGKSLSRDQAKEAMSALIQIGKEKLDRDDPITSKKISDFLIALKTKGESASEITGFVDCLQSQAVQVHFQTAEGETSPIDVCGTGGDGVGTFNVSTTVAWILASCGQKIAKHGNRSVSSRSGSFDVLEALNIQYETEPEKVIKSMNTFGIAFLFAPAFHPVLKTFAVLRKKMGVTTVFNALGPLLNPVIPLKRQLMGVYHPALLDKVAETLQIRGAEEAMIVRGEDGLDELSINAPTQVVHLKTQDGKTRIEKYLLSPKDFGLQSASLDSVRGGEAKENAKIIVGILQGEKSPRRDLVLMNSSAALVICGKAKNFLEGTELAAHAIDSGKAFQLLEKMRKNP